jgi:nitrogen fixation NifU-like protein
VLYSQKVMENFKNTKNYGQIKNADGIGKVGNPRCGDVMWIYIRVKDGRIADAKYETFGCVAAIATSSMAIDMIRGKTIDEALKLSNKAVAEALDGLPPEKMHCSLLAEQGIKAAVQDYLSKTKSVHSRE